MAFNDTFTENDVLRALENAGLEFKNGSRYILAQCPTHEDRHPSVQIFKSDWFANCLASCGRYHITKSFPELNGGSAQPHGGSGNNTIAGNRERKVVEHEYRNYDLFEQWSKLPLIPRDHVFKNIPLDVLDALGWRYLQGEIDGMGTGYFIPYFDPYKQTVPFAQTRHLTSDRRFTFLADARPVAYGRWNVIGNQKLFVVEGASDCAVMEYCGVPWIGMPSASSGTIMKELALFAKEQGVAIVYAGDNDEAGDKLRAALDEVAPYRVCQPPKDYKDWGDFFVAHGKEKVLARCIATLFE